MEFFPKSFYGQYRLGRLGSGGVLEGRRVVGPGLAEDTKILHDHKYPKLRELW